MAQSQRARMRDGPLADLFRSTLGDEHEQPVEPAVAKPGERATPEQQLRRPPSGVERSVAGREGLEAELRSAEARLERARDHDGELTQTLEAMESELASAKRWTDRAWDRAMRLLAEFEARAIEAERNAARAEELARRQSEQEVWEERLRVLLDRIGRYESRVATEPPTQRNAGN
jgi:chromosome segregation ATPase